MNSGLRKSFLIQAGLILLPMLLLAGVGAHLVKRDREAVLNDARDRANELAPRIAAYVGADLIDRMQADLREILQMEERDLPEDAQIDRFRTSLSQKEPRSFQVPMEEFHALMDFQPASRRGHVFDDSFGWIAIIDRQGELIFPRPFPKVPVPPVSTNELPDGEREQIRESVKNLTRSEPAIGSDSFELDSLFGDKSIDSPRARFIFDLAEEMKPANTALAGHLLRALSESDQEIASSAGIPMQPLAAIEWVRLQQEHPDSFNPDESPKERRDQLALTAILHPSSISELILHKLPHYLPTESDPTERNHWLDVWETLQSTLDFYSALRTSTDLTAGDDHSIPAAWVRWRNMDWWVGFAPEQLEQESAIPERFGVFPFSRVSLDLATKELLDEGDFLLPDGLGVRFTVDGQPISAVSETDVLASAEGEIIGGGPRGYRMFDGWFKERSLSSLTAHIVIADPEILLALQRERSRWLFAIIGGSLLVSLIGLTALYRSHSRQLALNEMKTNFVSSVSHELRAPIASVRLMTENLQQGKVTGEAKLQEYIAMIGQECRRLSALIGNVLDFARIEQGRKQYEFEPTDLTALIRETVRLMHPYATERQIHLHEQFLINTDTSKAPNESKSHDSISDTPSLPPLPPGEGRGEGHQRHTSNSIFESRFSTDQTSSSTAPLSFELTIDGRAIQQALINLIDNAIKHSPPNETVTIELKAPADSEYVQIIVEDHGPGVPAEEQKKIFECFYRRGSELRRETEGIGIGLSIVKHIIDAHHGRIRVESQPGHGSRFIIELQPRIPLSGTNAHK